MLQWGRGRRNCPSVQSIAGKQRRASGPSPAPTKAVSVRKARYWIQPCLSSSVTPGRTRMADGGMRAVSDTSKARPPSRPSCRGTERGRYRLTDVRLGSLLWAHLGQVWCS